MAGLSEQPPVASIAIAAQSFHANKLGQEKFLVRVVKEFILISQSMRKFSLESIRQKGESRF